MREHAKKGLAWRAEGAVSTTVTFPAGPGWAVTGGGGFMSSYSKKPLQLSLSDEAKSSQGSSPDEVSGSGAFGTLREGAMPPAFEQLVPPGFSADQAYGIIGNYDRFNQVVGFVLKKMANEQSQSCTSLAYATGIPRSTVSRYLNAKAPIPLYAFILLCHALNCNMVHVVGRALILLSK